MRQTRWQQIRREENDDASGWISWTVPITICAQIEKSRTTSCRPVPGEHEHDDVQTIKTMAEYVTAFPSASIVQLQTYK